MNFVTKEEKAMILDLKKLFVTENMSLPISYSLDLSDVEFAGEFPLKQPVSIEGQVKNKAGLVTLSVNVSYSYTAPCDRCTKECTDENSFSYVRNLATHIENEDSDSILTVPDYKLNLDEIFRDEVILDVPMKHLCKEDCKGICFGCGQNLNDGECRCSE